MRNMKKKMTIIKQSQAQEQQFNGLPYDIRIKVLSELPAKSLLRLKCVCKSWHELITDPYFIKLHLNRSIQDGNNNLGVVLRNACTSYVYSLHQHRPQRNNSNNFSITSMELNDVTAWKSPSAFHDTILGSCNGLILLHISHNHGDRIALWNPTTKDFKELPRPGFSSEENRVPLSNYHGVVLGLGYDPSKEDHKVIAIHKDTEVAVYPLQSRRWRSFETIPQGLTSLGMSSNARQNCTSGKYLNGVIHWLRCDARKILCFECGSEKWSEVGVPWEVDNTTDVLDFFVRRGRLCIVRDMMGRWDTWRADVYEMREYGVNDSWCKISSITYGDVVFDNWQLCKIWICRIVCVVKDGNFLILRNTHERNQLAVYNPENGIVTELNIDDTNVRKKWKRRQLKPFVPHSIFFESYIDCMVSLKDD